MRPIIVVGPERSGTSACAEMIHPVDIAVSWQKLCAASGSPVRGIDVNLLRWQHVSVEVLQHTDAVDAKQFVEYEALAAAPLSVAERLATFLDAHVGTTTARATIDRMAAAIDPALKRNEGGDAAMRRLSGPQRALYALQQARVDDPRTPLETSPMPDAWRARVIAEEARGL